MSEQEINDNKETKKRENEVRDNLSKIMSGFPGYDSVPIAAGIPFGEIYWAIIKQDNGKYTLERVKYVENSNHYGDFYIIDKNGVIKPEKKFSTMDFLGNQIWKKSLLATMQGKTSPSTLSIEERTRFIPPNANPVIGGKSRRYRKNSLRKRKSKKYKKRHHTKRR